MADDRLRASRVPVVGQGAAKYWRVPAVLSLSCAYDGDPLRPPVARALIRQTDSESSIARPPARFADPRNREWNTGVQRRCNDEAVVDRETRAARDADGRFMHFDRDRNRRVDRRLQNSLADFVPAAALLAVFAPSACALFAVTRSRQARCRRTTGPCERCLTGGVCGQTHRPAHALPPAKIRLDMLSGRRVSASSGHAASNPSAPSSCSNR